MTSDDVQAAMDRARQRIVEDAPVEILTPPTTGRTIKARPPTDDTSPDDDNDPA